MSALKLGDHSTTFSGNPLVCAAGCAAIDVLLEEKMVERAAKQGVYLKANLEKLQTKHKSVKEVRGLGLMLGMETKFDVLNILLKAKEKGVLVLDAGRNVVRFLPPFVISTDQIDKAISVLDSVLEEEENARASSASSN
jgi:acetylornithine/LysW-gamma-L-lysine aminotransferase